MTATRTALVTGASRGIGKACALALAKSGYRVAVAARSLDNLQDTESQVKDGGGEAYAVAMDVSDSGAIKAGFEKAAREFGRVDILINNAGTAKDGVAVRMKEQDWQTVLQTNLSGPFFAIRQVLPAMMRERWGRVVNISSVVGEMGNPGQANYVASKAGLIGL